MRRSPGLPRVHRRAEGGDVSDKIKNTLPFSLNGRNRVCIGEVFISDGPAAGLSVVMSAPPEGVPRMSGGVAVELLAKSLGMVLGRFVIEGHEEAAIAEALASVREGMASFKSQPTRQ